MKEEQIVEEKQIYEIVNFTKDDSYYDSKIAKIIIGKLVTIEEVRERRGPWFRGWVKEVGSGHRHFFLGAMLKKHTPNSES